MRLYEKGLIYQGSRIINWCPDCKTALSDTEVEHEQQQGISGTSAIPMPTAPALFLPVATTRLETMLRQYRRGPCTPTTPTIRT